MAWSSGGALGDRGYQGRAPAGRRRIDFGWMTNRAVARSPDVPDVYRSTHRLRDGDPRRSRQTGRVEAVDELIRALAPPLVAALPEQLREQHAEHARRLVERVAWETARGFEVDSAQLDRMAALVASHAALVVAGFSPATQPYRDVTSVVLHRGTIVSREPRPGPARGVMTDAPQHLAGQAGHGRRPIALDWRTVERDVARPERGQNVVYHEFAHKLDQLDGVFDGMPPLGSDRARAEWVQTLGTNFRRLVRHGRDPVIRAYAATNEVEYFAVTSELFFTVPDRLRDAHPRVYRRLADFYAQDPANLALR